MLCPLCQTTDVALFHCDELREYYRCECCQLVSVPPKFHLSAQDEKAHYDHHENDVNDPAYRQFLSKVTQPLLSKLTPQSFGLDYGSGPASAIAAMCTEAGHSMAVYDLYYQSDTKSLKRSYDFVTCTEVIEHIAQPQQLLSVFERLILFDGWLAIMTKFQPNESAFPTWYYIRDPTHICFYSKETFRWIAENHPFDIQDVTDDVVILRRRSSALHS